MSCGLGLLLNEDRMQRFHDRPRFGLSQAQTLVVLQALGWRFDVEQASDEPRDRAAFSSFALLTSGGRQLAPADVQPPVEGLGQRRDPIEPAAVADERDRRLAQ